MRGALGESLALSFLPSPCRVRLAWRSEYKFDTASIIVVILSKLFVSTTVSQSFVQIAMDAMETDGTRTVQ